MSVSIRKFKHEITINLTDPPLVGSSVGPTFKPFKVVVTDFGDRAKVDLTGIASRNSYITKGTNVAQFNLYGYPQYRVIPEWLIGIIRSAGYGGDINLTESEDPANV